MRITGLFGVFLLLSGIAIGLQARRRDPRFLVALTTPWLAFFLFPLEIHQRYLLFAAAPAAMCIGQSWGGAMRRRIISHG